jgi:LPPG:FO 2-phospho-L-lactate transferase
VGGAKLLAGLDGVLAPGELTAIVNVGDDDVIYGVHVSPDVDIVTYWLGQIADTDRGWGIRNDTFTVIDALERLGTDCWFRLGDRDFGTCLYRTERLRAGATLTETSDDVRRALGIATRILPASNDPIRTKIHTRDGRILDFQEYFVKEHQNPEVARVTVDGIESARPAPGVLESIHTADVVVVCPSNPVLSVGPILEIDGVRDALVAHPNVVAVTPIVRGAALKGPADKILTSMGIGARAASVAGLYNDFINAFVVDASDPTELTAVQNHGVRALLLDTVMVDRAASRRLAGELLVA